MTEPITTPPESGDKQGEAPAERPSDSSKPKETTSRPSEEGGAAAGDLHGRPQNKEEARGTGQGAGAASSGEGQEPQAAPPAEPDVSTLRGRSITEEERARIKEAYLGYLRTGLSRMTAANRAGISPTTVRAWRENDALFNESVEEARTARVAALEGQHDLLIFGKPAKNADGSPKKTKDGVQVMEVHKASDDIRRKAIEWTLERENPDEYSPHLHQEITGGVGLGINMPKGAVVMFAADDKALKELTGVEAEEKEEAAEAEKPEEEGTGDDAEGAAGKEGEAEDPPGS